MATDHERNTELLNFELPDRRFEAADYLAWLYDDNPHGGGVYRSIDEGGRRVAHYALIPQEYRSADGPAPLMFSLNAVTHREAQRSGHFVSIGKDIYEQARVEGRAGILAVPNENSTPGALKYLGYRFLGPLPVRVGTATAVRRAGFASYAIDSEFLGSDTFADLAATVDDHPTHGWTQRWPTSYLKWRLARPRGEYALHVSDALVAVSTRSSFASLPVAVVLKLLPRDTAPGRQPASGAVAAACRYHRAPLWVYAGFNARVRVRGAAPPRRLQPAPLNLLYRSLGDRIDEESFTLDTFEFLDFDAY